MADPARERRKAEKRRQKKAHDREALSGRPTPTARAYTMVAVSSLILGVILVVAFVRTFWETGWGGNHLVRQLIGSLATLMLLYGGMNIYAAVRVRSRRPPDDR